MAMTIQVKRGIKASLPTLQPGEFALCTDTSQLYMGSQYGNIELLLNGFIPASVINQRTGLEMKFWMGTKAMYDALATPRDANTVFLIQDGWLGNIKIGT